jgi:hypothetical protein
MAIVQETRLAFSLSRMYKLMQDDSHVFGIISACRSGYDKDDPINNDRVNSEQTKKLAKDIKVLNRGYVLVNGWYVETNKEEKEVEVIEGFFIVSGISLEDLVKLGKRYSQESVLFKDSDGVRYVDPIGGQVLDKFKTDLSTSRKAVKKYFTQFKNKGNRKFIFIEDMRANSHARAVMGRLNEFVRLDLNS